MVSRWTSVCLSVRPSVSRTSVRISFPDDNLSKYQWISTKLGTCIDIVEIRFGIANGQFSSHFDGALCPRHVHVFVPDDILSKHQWIFSKLGMCFFIVEIWFWIANGQIICSRHTHIFVSGSSLSKCQGILAKLGTCNDM